MNAAVRAKIEAEMVRRGCNWWEAAARVGRRRRRRPEVARIETRGPRAGHARVTVEQYQEELRRQRLD